MVVAELAVGALGEFINCGLKRAVSAPFQKMARLEKVDHAARLRSSSDPLVQAALADYVTVLGSYQGKYTSSADMFLRSLESGGIIEAMVENALIGRTSDEIEASFLTLHATYFPAENGNELYRSMMAAFTASLRETANDPVLFTLARQMQAEIRNRLDAVDQSLKSISKSNLPDSISADDLNDKFHKICKGLVQSYRNIRIETNRGPKNVEINKIYVPAKLALRETDFSKRQLERISKLAVNPSSAHKRRVSAHNPDELKIFSYGEFPDIFRRAVVLGDPGGGKSTLCQKFCFDLAKGLALFLQFGEKSQVSASQRKLPVRVILRKFEQARSIEPQLTLLHYICKDIMNFYSGSADEIEQVLTHHMRFGQVILAFDGLDEILDTSMRQDYCDLVYALCNEFPLCPVLVTSRLIGYDDARLPDEFEELILQKFDEAEIRSYVGKFMGVVGAKTKAEAAEASIRFIEQTKNAGADLRRNPLMLGLMGWLFLNNDDIPSNRPEIYRECATLMFERWDQKRGIVADDMSEFDRLQLFIHLASEIYGRPQLAGGVSKEWLEQSLKNVFFKLYESNAKAFQASKMFVKFITGRAWIMSEVGDSVFSFTHQTFLEYFFARHLEDSHDTVASILKALKPRIINSEWNEVTHLALQIKTYKSLRKQEEALSVLTNYLNQAKTAKHKHALLMFIGRSLEYLNPAESRISELIADVGKVVWSRVEMGQTRAMAFFALALKAAPERREFVREKIFQNLSDRLMNSPSDSAIDAVSGVVAPTTFAYGGDPFGDMFSAEDQQAFMKVVKADVIANASVGGRLRGIGWSWYGQLSKSLSPAESFLLIFNNPFIGSIMGIDGCVALVLFAMEGMRVDRSIPIEKQYALELIASVGKNVESILPVSRAQMRNPYFHGEIPVDFWKRALGSVSDDYQKLGILTIAAVNFDHQNPRTASRSAMARREQFRSWVDTALKKIVVSKSGPASFLSHAMKSGQVVVEPIAPPLTEQSNLAQS
ncbi:NACHT domain-containing protein [Sphingomonas trueperi]|uniref:NACHT domain-containing protein n=1 Tax=Sphingomonas trueperi TaxID=53317 RepID=UPI000EB551E9